MVTMKLVELELVFPATVTAIGPVVAPTGTVVVIVVEVLAVTIAAVPLKVTVLLAAIELKFVPVIETVAPTNPEGGVKEIIVGGNAAVTEKLPVLTCVHSPPLSLART